MSEVQLCKVCHKSESDIGHQEHPHNGDPISHYFQASGKFITREESERRKRVEELRGDVRVFKYQLKQSIRGLRQANAELKKLRACGLPGGTQ